MSGAGSARPSVWPGILWIVWCALMFVLALGGVQWLFERAVVLPDCERSCAAQGSTLVRLEIGHRTSSTCACADGSRLPTDLPDAGVLVSVLVFLPACYLPLALATRRARRVGGRGPVGGSGR